MPQWITCLFCFLIAAVIGAFLIYYLRKEKKREKATLAAAERRKLRSDGPVTIWGADLIG